MPKLNCLRFAVLAALMVLAGCDVPLVPLI